MVTSDAALDAKTVKGCAFSDKANCYKAASFIALFKCNDYVFNYDANGGQLNTAGVQIEPRRPRSAPMRCSQRLLRLRAMAISSFVGIPLRLGWVLLLEKVMRSAQRRCAVW